MKAFATWAGDTCLGLSDLAFTLPHFGAASKHEKPQFFAHLDGHLLVSMKGPCEGGEP